MTDMLLVALALLGLLLIVVAILRWSPRSPERIRLVAKPLMTSAEREVLVQLERAAPRCRVHAQVAMGALMQPERGLDRKDRAHWRNRFSQKIVDFVLEDRASGDVVALVELDDRTHDPRRDRDRDRMTAACGFRTVRLSNSPRTTGEEVAARLGAAVTGYVGHGIADTSGTESRPQTPIPPKILAGKEAT